MAIKTIHIDILRVLIDKNTFLSLNEITSELKKYNISARLMQIELKKLIDTHR